MGNVFGSDGFVVQFGKVCYVLGGCVDVLVVVEYLCGGYDFVQDGVGVK